MRTGRRRSLGTRVPRPRAALPLLAMLVAATAMSQFWRAALGVIAPELTRDLDLSPQMLGNANAAFFVALAVLQIPLGLLFDRWGARRSVAVLCAAAVAGALLHAASTSGTQTVTAHFLVGIGNAASFMATVYLCSRWFAGERLSTALSWVFALSQIGIFLAATPLAAASTLFGWRAAFAVMAVASGAVGLLFWLLVRDDPPDRPVPPRRKETGAEVLRGLLEVWRTPGLFGVLAMHAFAYASMATVIGLWAAPYLADVHGLDPVARGNVVLAMGAAQLLGILVVGPLDRIFNTRKWVVVCGAVGTIAILAALALARGLPLWAAIALLVALCAVTTYGVVIVAHGRSLFPDHLAGRGVTTVNLAQVFGTTALPILTGWVIGHVADGQVPAPELAYRLAFGAIALCLAAGLAVYLFARDSPPRP
jgi:MFS family permease